MRPRPTTSGAAIVIALIILAGLILLGLPFLFSQSSSLAGSRSYFHHQAATAGLDGAEQLAVAAAAYGQTGHLVVGGGDQDWSRLDDNLAPIIATEVLTENLIALDAKVVGFNQSAQRAALVGTSLSDEQGRLDPNHLDVAAWDRLLQAAGILDWDDNMATDSQDFQADPPGDADGNGDDDDDGVDGDQNGDNDDGGDFGELAEALANLRFSLPGRRITSLDQLLLADPGHNRSATVTVSYPLAPGSMPGAGDSFGFRRPLTRAEVGQLAPLLSVHIPEQGRGGLIDVGTELMQNGGQLVLDSDPRDSLAVGTMVAWPDTGTNGGSPRFGRVDGVGLQTSINTGHTALANRAFTISAASGVNLHHALPAVMKALQDPVFTAQAGSGNAPITTLADLLTGTPSPDDAWYRLDPRATTRELPPVDISSYGVVRIESQATANDAQGRVSAGRDREIVAQALPPEQVLERRWQQQDQFQALVVQRFAANVSTWPEPLERVKDRRADTTLAPGSAAKPVGVTAATLPSLATGYRQRLNGNPVNRKPSHLAIDFRVPLGADAVTDAATILQEIEQGLNAGPGPSSAYTDADLRPDGLLLGKGALTWALSAEGAGPTGPLRGTTNTDHSLRGRHVSFWFKPENDWAAPRIVPLLEVRMPDTNAGLRIDGEPGSNELQNYLGIFYDRDKQLLVAVMAPPVIEHPLDYGPLIPPDELNLTFDLDERCLGDPAGDPYNATGLGPTMPLAPAQPNPGAADLFDEANALFSIRATRLFKPNRIIHVLKVGDSAAGDPYFRGKRWYHLNLVLGGDQPGQVLMLLDNLAGQDVTRTPPIDTTTMKTGDRLCLPCLPLTTGIPYIAKSGTGTYADPAAELQIASIEVDPVLGLGPAELFPARGVLLIDDEYFTYEEIVGNAFLRCQRAQRQNCQVDTPATPEERFPATQGHLAGALVKPGGYRQTALGSRLYRGGAVLKHPLLNGDPDTAGPHPWTIWAPIDPDGAGIDNSLDPALVWPAAVTDLVLEGVAAYDQFPLAGGVIRIDGDFYWYDQRAAGSPVLINVQAITALPLSTLPDLTLSPHGDLNFNRTAPPAVYLVSLEMDPGAIDPFDGDTYNLTTNYTLLQLLHFDGALGSGSGRVEWITYTRLVRNAGRPFIVNDDQWGPGTRGVERTDFIGRTAIITPYGPLNSRLTPASFFPSGSLVLPVQHLGGASHWVATGDVLTILPKAYAPGIGPWQAVVRYATVDGYRNGTVADPCPSQWDTKNEYFAFAHPLPLLPDHAAALYDLAVWPGWSGQDLTPRTPTSGAPTTMPRLDLWSTGAPPELALGGPSPVAANGAFTPTELTDWQTAREPAPDVTIDAIVAGSLSNAFNNFTPSEGLGITRAFNGGEVTTDLARIGNVVEASRQQFFDFSPNQFGLVLIDGEVFAYRQLTNAEAGAVAGSAPGVPNANNVRTQGQYALLIGRGLLDLVGTPDPIHSLSDVGPLTAAGTILRGLLPAMPLPVGPVALIDAPITDGTWFRFTTGIDASGAAVYNALDAPLVMVCDPAGDPDRATILGLAGGVGRNPLVTYPGTWYLTQAWLRGLYHSDPAGAGNTAGDLVIGWWPRHASALPDLAERPDLTGDALAALFRCRQYAWLGFPAGAHRARFDLVNLPAGLLPRETGLIAVEDTGTGTLFGIEARALASGFDWSSVTPTLLFNFAPAQDCSAAFAHPQFDNQEVTGAEMRVTWSHLGPNSSRLDAIAEASGSSPFFSSAHLRYVAPTAILAVEEAR